MDRPVVAAGFLAAGLALVGTLLPESPNPPAVALAALSLLGYSAVRYGLLDVKRGAAVGALGGGGVTAHALVFGSGNAALLAGAGGVGAALAASFVGGDAAERAGAVVQASLVGVGGYLVIVLASVYVLTALDAFGLAENPLASTVSSQLSTLLGALIAAGFYLATNDEGRSYIDLSIPGRRAVIGFVGGAGATVVVYLGAAAAFAALGIETSPHQIQETVAGNPELLVALVPASFLFVGVGEELLFRNLVQKRLAEEFPDAWAVTLASGVFAAVHLTAYLTDGGSPGASLLVVFAVSLVFGAAYAYSGNLLVPIALHGTYDSVVYAIMVYGA